MLPHQNGAAINLAPPVKQGSRRWCRELLSAAPVHTQVVVLDWSQRTNKSVTSRQDGNGKLARPPSPSEVRAHHSISRPIVALQRWQQTAIVTLNLGTSENDELALRRHLTWLPPN